LFCNTSILHIEVANVTWKDTVAILAQGTHWAVATSQAFFACNILAATSAALLRAYPELSLFSTSFTICYSTTMICCNGSREMFGATALRWTGSMLTRLSPRNGSAHILYRHYKDCPSVLFYMGNDGLGFLRAGTRHRQTKVQIKPEDRTTPTHLGPARKNSRGLARRRG
jgi:hypothetical protein